MNRKKAIMILAAVLILAVGVGIGAYAASGFGTQSDPLVAKSYIDNVLTPALQAQYQSQLDAQVQKLEQSIANVSVSGSGNFIALSLNAGQVLAGNAGCEIILTSGSATASGSALADITSGTALTSGSTTTVNHLYVIAADGGGVMAADTVTLLVRGAYTVG